MVYRIGIIGFGWVAQHHLKGYKHLNNVEVVAVADVNMERLKIAEEKWQIRRLFKDYHELLRQEDIDVVDISVPTHLHTQVSIDCCNAKKHVLCEKPLALSIEEVNNIFRAVRKNKVKFAVNQNMRWLPKYQVVKKLVDQNAIGSLLLLHFDMFGWDYPESGWMTDMEKYVVFQIAVHWIDLFQYWLDKSPLRVLAVTNSSPAQPKMRGENMCIIVLDYGNHCYGQINCCGYSQSKKMFAESVFRIEGSEGTIEHNGKLRVKNRHMREWIKPPIPSVPCNEYDWTFSVSMRQLIEAIEGNEKPATSIENNMKVIKTVYACYESAIARKWISIGSHQLK